MVEDKASLKREMDKIQKQLDTLTTKLESLAAVEEVGRIRTHIKGFDAKIGGGIPRSHVVLLAGPTGTMKSSIALSILSHHIEAGGSGSYLTLEESKESLLGTAAGLGLGLFYDLLRVDVVRGLSSEGPINGEWSLLVSLDALLWGIL